MIDNETAAAATRTTANDETDSTPAVATAAAVVTATSTQDGQDTVMQATSATIQPNTSTDPLTDVATVPTVPIKPKKRIVIRRKPGGVSTSTSSSSTTTNDGSNDTKSKSVPIIDEVLYEQIITNGASGLPIDSYEFEIRKCIYRCIELQVQHVGLQMPEGLLMYGTTIGDVLKKFCPTLLHISILGDVSYGACCIDDISASLLQCDLLIHYGHSCLVPSTVLSQPNHNTTSIPILYVFVEIQINVQHIVDCFHATILTNIEKEKQQQEQEQKQPEDDSYTITEKKVDDDNALIESLNLETKIDKCESDKLVIYLLGTVQFRHTFVLVQQLLINKGYTNTYIPQVKPLSPGEVLGCTSPLLKEHIKLQKKNGNIAKIQSIVIFVADGRFHMESTMICNPNISIYYRYNPYTQYLTIEEYDYIAMEKIRYDAIQRTINYIHQSSTTAVQVLPSSSTTTVQVPINKPTTFGIILGTLGRQGNPAIIQRIKDVLNDYNTKWKLNNNIHDTSIMNTPIRHFTLLLSEITPHKLSLFQNRVQVWVQVACPRLSIDWGHYLASTGDSTTGTSSSNNNSSSQSIPVLNPYELYCCFDTSLWKQPTSIVSKGGKVDTNNNIINFQDEEHKIDNITASTAKCQNNKDCCSTTTAGSSTAPTAQSLSSALSYYPMDYYSYDGGPWTNYHASNKQRTMNPESSLLLSSSSSSSSSSPCCQTNTTDSTSKQCCNGNNNNNNNCSENST